MLAGNLAGCYLYVGAQLCVWGTGLQCYLRYSGYRGQGFASESHGVESKEVFGVAYLARGMVLERQRCVVWAHALSVVYHLYE